MHNYEQLLRARLHELVEAVESEKGIAQAMAEARLALEATAVTFKPRTKTEHTSPEGVRYRITYSGRGWRIKGEDGYDSYESGKVFNTKRAAYEHMQAFFKTL